MRRAARKDDGLHTLDSLGSSLPHSSSGRFPPARRWLTVLSRSSGEGLRFGVKLHFAGDIAVTAMLRHKANESDEEFATKIIRIVAIGYGQAVMAIDAINACYLWDRFR